MRVRKKPVVVDAIRFTGTNHAEVARFLLLGTCEWEPGIEGFTIKTLEGEMLARRGDWIVMGVHSETYPVKADIFAATYELLEDGPR